jgi:hypothetical protein
MILVTGGVEEVHQSAGEKFLEVERDPTLRPDLSKRIHCPRDGEIMDAPLSQRQTRGCG